MILSDCLPDAVDRAALEEALGRAGVQVVKAPGDAAVWIGGRGVAPTGPAVLRLIETRGGGIVLDPCPPASRSGEPDAVTAGLPDLSPGAGPATVWAEGRDGASRVALEPFAPGRVREIGSPGDWRAGDIVVTAEAGPVAWEALAAGLVVAAPRDSVPVQAGLAVPFEAPGDLAPLLAAEQGVRPAPASRDAVLGALAALDAACVPPDPAILAAAIARALAVHPDRERPAISVVITNYNYGRYLGEAIESVRAQTLPPAEIIVVDDGSTDGSREVIARYPDIVAVLKENGGQGSAFNAGLARATGDVVMFLDADDRLKPFALEAVAEGWRGGLVRLEFPLDTIDAGGAPTGPYPDAAHDGTGEEAGKLLAKGIYPFMPTSGNAFNRAALAAIGPVPEESWRISADLYLVLASALVGRSARLADALAEYRIHGENAHFGRRGDDPGRLDRLRPARMQAWRDLIGLILTRGGTDAGLRAMMLQRRLLLALRRQGAGTGAVMREAARAAGLAVRSWEVPWRLRVAQVVFAGRALVGDAARLGDCDGVMRWEEAEVRDPMAKAGPTSWPGVEDGVRIAFTDAPRDGRYCGHGLLSGGPAGLGLVAEHGVLAVSLHGPARAMDVTLDYVLHEAAPRRIGLSCGGAETAIAEPAPVGTLRLTVPAEAAVTLGPGRIGLALEVGSDAAPEQVRLTALRVASHRPAGPLPGIAIAPGEGIGFDGSDPVARALGRGWGWPGPEGVALLRAPARLHLLPASGGGRLRLRFDPAPPEGLMVSGADGFLPVTKEGADALLGPVPGSGRLDLELFFAEGGAPSHLLGVTLEAMAGVEQVPGTGAS